MRNTVLVIFFFLGSLQAVRPQAPRIVNVINFVRQTEPRYEDVTDEVLFNTTVEEMNLLKRYGMKGTFLLQLMHWSIRFISNCSRTVRKRV